MSWGRLDDTFYDHPKTIEAIRLGGLAAIGLHVLAWSYSNRHLTDGFISDGWVGRRTKLAEALVNARKEPNGSGMWERVEGGYRIHDFLDFNPSAESVREKRRKDSERKRAGIQKDSVRIPAVPTQTRPKEIKQVQERAHSPSLLSHFQPQDLADLWNVVLVKPRVLELRSTRLTHTRARLREHPEPDWWRQVLARMSATPFLRGAGKQQWVANFDWLVANPTNAVAVLEGKYDDGVKPRDRPSVPLAVRAAEIGANVGRVHRDARDVRQDHDTHRAVPVLSVHAGGAADLVDPPGTP